MGVSLSQFHAVTSPRYTVLALPKESRKVDHGVASLLQNIQLQAPNRGFIEGSCCLPPPPNCFIAPFPPKNLTKPF